ncbi:MAG TPA: hypothetical protein VNS81_00170 [Nocardioides sp.]|nr:hypothetical protein [Nocardioides sp.]
MSGPSVKVSADWLDSDHIEDLGADAVLLMLTALAHSARQTSEGIVPRRQLRKLWPVASLEDTIVRLVDVGEVEEREGDLYFVNWREFLLSADEVSRIKEQNRTRDERRRRHNKGDHSMCQPKYCHRAREESEALTRESHVGPRVSHADPILTDPDRSDPTEGRGSGGRRKPDGQQSAPGSAAPPAATAAREQQPPSVEDPEQRLGLNRHTLAAECCPFDHLPQHPIHQVDDVA